MIEGSVMWTSEETHELIALWRRTDTQVAFRSSGRNLAIWDRIAQELLERGFFRSAHQCRAKLHNMVCLYRKVERGEIPRSRCKHFETLRGITTARTLQELREFNAPWEEHCRRHEALRALERRQQEQSRTESATTARQDGEVHTSSPTEAAAAASPLGILDWRRQQWALKTSGRCCRAERRLPDLVPLHRWRPASLPYPQPPLASHRGGREDHLPYLLDAGDKMSDGRRVLSARSVHSLAAEDKPADGDREEALSAHGSPSQSPVVPGGFHPFLTYLDPPLAGGGYKLPPARSPLPRAPTLLGQQPPAGAGLTRPSVTRYLVLPPHQPTTSLATRTGVPDLKTVYTGPSRP